MLTSENIEKKNESNNNQFLGEDNEPEIFNNNEFFETEKETKTDAPSTGLFSRFTAGIKNLLGNNALTEDNIKPIMQTFIDMLMEKNVAKEIAENLCESVTKSLLKTKTESFTTINTTVRNTLKETISKILTPKEDLDVLKQATTAKGRGDPYKVVFIGVNGYFNLIIFNSCILNI